MLCELEFPMYFYCGVLNVGRGLIIFLGKKTIMYAIVATNRSDLAGRLGFAKSKISIGLFDKDKASWSALSFCTSAGRQKPWPAS